MTYSTVSESRSNIIICKRNFSFCKELFIICNRILRQCGYGFTLSISILGNAYTCRNEKNSITVVDFLCLK